MKKWREKLFAWRIEQGQKLKMENTPACKLTIQSIEWINESIITEFGAQRRLFVFCLHFENFEKNAHQPLTWFSKREPQKRIHQKLSISTTNGIVLFFDAVKCLIGLVRRRGNQTATGILSFDDLQLTSFCASCTQRSHCKNESIFVSVNFDWHYQCISAENAGELWYGVFWVRGLLWYGVFWVRGVLWYGVNCDTRFIQFGIRARRNSWRNLDKTAPSHFLVTITKKQSHLSHFEGTGSGYAVRVRNLDCSRRSVTVNWLFSTTAASKV